MRQLLLEVMAVLGRLAVLGTLGALLALLALSRLAGAELVVADVAALPGTTVVTPLTLNLLGDEVSGLEFRIARPVVVSGLSAQEGPGAEAASKGLSCSSSGGELLCLLFGVNQNVLADGAVVALLAITVSDSFSADTNLVLSDLAATDAGGNAVELTGDHGVVQLGSGPCDINRDGVTNVVDVQLVVNAVLTPGTCGPE